MGGVDLREDEAAAEARVARERSCACAAAEYLAARRAEAAAPASAPAPAPPATPARAVRGAVTVSNLRDALSAPPSKTDTRK